MRKSAIFVEIIKLLHYATFNNIDNSSYGVPPVAGADNG